MGTMPRKELMSRVLEALRSYAPPARGAQVLTVRYNKQTGRWGAGMRTELVHYGLWTGVGFVVGAGLGSLLRI